MEGAVKLTVPLTVDVGVGENWKEAKSCSRPIPANTCLRRSTCGPARATRHGHRVSLWHMQDEREVTVELEGERRDTEITSIGLAPDDLEPDTLRAVIESFVLREGTDYGVHETSLEDKVAQVLIQLRRGEAHITFDPATESVNVVVTSAIGGSGRP